MQHELTDEQQAAVESTADRTLVIAGAGSGKTRVLCHRIKRVIEQGVSPPTMMVLTFTRKAAGEMIERLETMLHGKLGDGLFIGTFHSIALSILRADGDKLGYSPGSITVASEDDAVLLLEHVADLLGYRNKGKWCAGMSLDKLRKFLAGFYNTGEYPRERPDKPAMTVRTHNPVDADLKRVIVEYHAQLFNMNMLDFGRIMIECRRLLTEHLDVRARWSERIRHVIVDEAQDCDTVQYDLHEFFVPPATLFLVADRRQSIYGFRGAAPHLITERNPAATVFDLRKCFRCGDRIVQAANRLIKHNGDTLAKPMIGATGRIGVAKAITGRSLDICNEVQRRRAAGYACSDIAVLARTRKTLRRLATILTEGEIPHHVVGSRFDVCSTAEFKLLHAALRLIVNPKDRMAFLRICRDVGVPVSDTNSCLHERRDDPVGRLIEWGPPDKKPFDASCVFQHIHDARCLTEKLLIPIVDICGAMCPGDMDGAMAFWVKARGEQDCRDWSVDEALRWFALRDSHDDLTKGDQVTLSTIHGAKGLEWPVVIVAECNEGSLPGSRAKTEEDIQEERRVAYVAFTRAKEALLVHWRRPGDQSQDRGRKVSEPSRFLSEAGLHGAGA